jgi:hypothetical protein
MLNKARASMIDGIHFAHVFSSPNILIAKLEITYKAMPPKVPCHKSGTNRAGVNGRVLRADEIKTALLKITSRSTSIAAIVL